MASSRSKGTAKGAEAAKVPVTVLTGFLGSGKTTLLNKILSNKRGLKIAVIENEFGAIDIDGKLVEDRDVERSTDEVVEMINGCICCTVRQDLKAVLVKLLVTEKRSFHAIIIETTGLADPAPVAQTFFVDEELRDVCVLDAIVTVVDASHIEQQLSRDRPEGVENEAEEQLAFADKIILNKLDLVPDRSMVEAIKARIRAFNPLAEIIETSHAEVPMEKIMGLEAFNLQRVLDKEPDFLDIDAKHEHDKTVNSFCLQDPAPIVLHLLERWIGSLIREFGEKNLFRYKGILNVKGCDSRFVFQGVHMIFQGSFSTPWRAGEVRENKFVFIGRELPQKRILSEFRALRAGELRFAVGTKVLVQIGELARGTVKRHWDEGNCYRVTVDAMGYDVWAPVDEDSFIRAI